MNTDGIKLFLDDGLTSLLIRKSGTEPLLRFYIESNHKDRIEKMIESYYKFIFYLEDMMEKGNEEGYNLISFMGP